MPSPVDEHAEQAARWAAYQQIWRILLTPRPDDAEGTAEVAAPSRGEDG
jgi:hypothetical protein